MTFSDYIALVVKKTEAAQYLNLCPTVNIIFNILWKEKKYL